MSKREQLYPYIAFQLSFVSNSRQSTSRCLLVETITESVLHYRTCLKRKNYSNHTRKNYVNRLQHFLGWLPVAVESAE